MTEQRKYMSHVILDATLGKQIFSSSPTDVLQMTKPPHMNHSSLAGD